MSGWGLLSTSQTHWDHFSSPKANYQDNYRKQLHQQSLVSFSHLGWSILEFCECSLSGYSDDFQLLELLVNYYAVEGEDDFGATTPSPPTKSLSLIHSLGSFLTLSLYRALSPHWLSLLSWIKARWRRAWHVAPSIVKESIIFQIWIFFLIVDFLKKIDWRYFDSPEI